MCRKSSLPRHSWSFVVQCPVTSDNLLRDWCLGFVTARIKNKSRERKKERDHPLLPLTWEVSCAERTMGQELRVCEGRSRARSCWRWKRLRSLHRNGQPLSLWVLNAEFALASPFPQPGDVRKLVLQCNTPHLIRKKTKEGTIHSVYAEESTVFIL